MKNKVKGYRVKASDLFEATYHACKDYSVQALITQVQMINLVIDFKNGDNDYVHIIESLGNKMAYTELKSVK